MKLNIPMGGLLRLWKDALSWNLPRLPHETSLGLQKLTLCFFSVYSWEVLKTRVLATLVAVSACRGFDAVSSKVQVSVGNIQKVLRLSHETGFNMGLRMYCQKSSWDMP